MAISFIDNPNGLLDINHIDENKLNNNINNLEWCDKKYNNNYGKHKDVLFGEPKQIQMIDKKTGEILKIFDCIQDAEKYLNIPQAHSNIIACLKGRRKSAYNFIWKYFEK